MAIKEKEIVHEFSGGNEGKSSGDSKMQQFKSLADTFKSLDASSEPQSDVEMEEEKKGEEGKQEVQKVDLVAKANQLVASKPWVS